MIGIKNDPRVASISQQGEIDVLKKMLQSSRKIIVVVGDDFDMGPLIIKLIERAGSCEPVYFSDPQKNLGHKNAKGPRGRWGQVNG